jgi:hypothetical protein
VQAFVDELRLWMPSVIGRTRSHAPLFSHMEIEDKTGQVSVAFTPEGLACFHGWLHRQGHDPVLGTS